MNRKLALGLVAALALTACPKDGSLEEAGERADEAIDDAKDKAGDILRAFAALVQRDQDTLVIRAQSRPNQLVALQQAAETQPYVKQGCEHCDVL